MPIMKTPIAPCLWFDGNAEQAVSHYVTIFPNSMIVKVARYGQVGQDIHHREPGSVMTVAFELDGQPFVALNGGPLFKFSEAVSFQVFCDTQDEIDHYWAELSAGGQEGPCGWLKDKFGLSWQVVPSAIPCMMTDPDPAKSDRVMAAVLTMKKFDLGALERAYAGAA